MNNKEKELVDFGNYLLSEERKDLFKSHPRGDKLGTLEERLSNVCHSDICSIVPPNN